MLRQLLVVSFAAITFINAQAPTLSTLDAYKKAVQSNQPCVIMFTGSHCGPCRLMKPHFHNVAASSSDIQCYIIDAACQELKPILRHLDVMSIPTLICCQDGKVFHRTNGGLTGKGIKRIIQEFHTKRKSKNHLQMAAPATPVKPVTPAKQTATPKATIATKPVDKKSSTPAPTKKPVSGKRNNA